MRQRSLRPCSIPFCPFRGPTARGLFRIGSIAELELRSCLPFVRIECPRFCRLTVKECILEKFAGEPKKGIFSPSVQNTLYLAAKMVLDRVEEVSAAVPRGGNSSYN